MRRAVEAYAAVALASCALDDSAGTETHSDASTSPTGALTLPTDGLGEDEPKLDLATPDADGPDCGLNNGDLGLSYIWIANSTQGTVSKIDPVTAANSDEYSGIRRVG